MTLKKALEADYGYRRALENSSNLSGSTLKSLIVTRLKKSVDKMWTKYPMNNSYKEPKIYDHGGDITKMWFIFYSYVHPTKKTPTGGPFFQRFKVYMDINSEKTLTKRRELATAYRTIISQELKEGFNPFEPVNKKPKKQLDIGFFLGQYLEHILQGGLSRHTKSKYNNQLNTFRQWLQENDLYKSEIKQIRKQHIRDFQAHLKAERQCSGRTLNDYIDTVRAFFNYFIKNYDDLITTNPAAQISKDKVIIKGNIAFSDTQFSEIKRLMVETDPYLWVFCQFVYYSALRNEAEAINIKVKNIDLRNDRIYVPGEIAKGRQNQTLPIYPEFKELLQAMNIEAYDPEYYVFGRNDKPGLIRIGEDRFARRFRDIKLKAGLGKGYGIYCFKHTRACHLHDDGARLRDIQLLFRHTDMAVTMKYLRTLGRVERDRPLTNGRKI